MYPPSTHACDLQALTCLTALLELHLPGNYLGDMGVCALAKAAATLSHLRSLHLQVRPGRKGMW